MVHQLVPLPAVYYFSITTLGPEGWIFYDANADHVQVDVSQAAGKVMIGGNRSGMITVLPKGTLSGLSLIEFLGAPPGNQLHAIGKFSPSVILNQSMNMIGSDHIVENAEPIAFFSLKKPSDPAPAISSKLSRNSFL